MDHPHNYGSSNSKRSYTEIADVGFDEPVLSNPDPSSLSYSQLPTSAIGTFSQPRSAAAATAGDDCPEPQVHVPLPLPVEQKLNAICEEKKQPQPGADLRRRLGLLGEEKALELLGKISNTKKKIKNLSGYIWFLLREKYQCAPRSRSPSPSPSPSKSGPAASPLLHSPSSASQIRPGRQGSTSGGQKQLHSYFPASRSKSARTSLFRGPSSALPISPVHEGPSSAPPPTSITPVQLFQDNRYYLQCSRDLNVNAATKESNYKSKLDKDCRSSTRRKTRPKTIISPSKEQKNQVMNEPLQDILYPNEVGSSGVHPSGPSGANAEPKMSMEPFTFPLRNNSPSPPVVEQSKVVLIEAENVEVPVEVARIPEQGSAAPSLPATHEEAYLTINLPHTPSIGVVDNDGSSGEKEKDPSSTKEAHNTYFLVPHSVPDASKEKPSTPSQSNKQKEKASSSSSNLPEQPTPPAVVYPNISLPEVLLELQKLKQKVDSPSQKPSVQQAQDLKQSFKHWLEGGFDVNFQRDMLNQAESTLEKLYELNEITEEQFKTFKSFFQFLKQLQEQYFQAAKEAEDMQQMKLQHSEFSTLLKSFIGEGTEIRDSISVVDQQIQQLEKELAKLKAEKASLASELAVKVVEARSASQQVDILDAQLVNSNIAVEEPERLEIDMKTVYARIVALAKDAQL
ncbi:uncharacterized protein LOC126596268 isoform X4 [Malus sylvestris]|uniref:uncharacterized protein LOC126596268 isoform X4 n=1 Tax=Malus sylvestris TaxID=3752 RepID=UPI0021ACEFF2|nr:uncharacterized protein LOC126596268 isoform X4 [Malus sylvestris]